MGKLVWGWGAVYAAGVAVYAMYLLKRYVFTKR